MVQPCLPRLSKKTNRNDLSTRHSDAIRRTAFCWSCLVAHEIWETQGIWYYCTLWDKLYHTTLLPRELPLSVAPLVAAEDPLFVFFGWFLPSLVMVTPNCMIDINVLIAYEMRRPLPHKQKHQRNCLWHVLQAGQRHVQYFAMLNSGKKLISTNPLKFDRD